MTERGSRSIDKFELHSAALCFFEYNAHQNVMVPWYYFGRLNYHDQVLCFLQNRMLRDDTGKGHRITVNVRPRYDGRCAILGHLQFTGNLLYPVHGVSFSPMPKIAVLYILSIAIDDHRADPSNILGCQEQKMQRGK